MEFYEVFTDLRKKMGFSQNQVADELHVTRQAVSRWERGETIPEPETLLALSRLFDVSVNTLLGSPRALVCQSCGMPLSDEFLSREADGTLNEKYCKWCWDDGRFAQDCTMEEMVEHCIPNMPLGQSDPEACRAYMRGLLPTLERWKTP
ncbi:helix-turn-helix domain-containing protein [Oscillibacter valericigenes]|uniref:zinc ribbon domain-containing protein n=1 Tax=Oscillibacter valericigenes TaxID=351091 RepID=UPI001F3639B0|nr:zinc ribbon domain-containing protein [Oscillibacter valericigenes]MCF2665302.1 helix-turn-helix domain-containing protein [Oscillibacter valericigenes]